MFLAQSVTLQDSEYSTPHDSLVGRPITIVRRNSSKGNDWVASTPTTPKPTTPKTTSTQFSQVRRDRRGAVLTENASLPDSVELPTVTL